VEAESKELDIGAARVLVALYQLQDIKEQLGYSEEDQGATEEEIYQKMQGWTQYDEEWAMRVALKPGFMKKDDSEAERE
jgi:hypothetical protein